MRHKLLPIALIFTAMAVRAAEQGPADMSLVGPDTAATGSTVRLRLDGLPAVDLTKTMNEQLAWLSQVRIVTAAPAGVTEKDFSLDQQLSIKVSPFQWTFSLDFTATKPGDYVLIVDWNEAPFGLVHHRVQVRGGTPPDEPDPPIPPPHKATGALILFEDDDMTPQQAVTLNTARNDPALQGRVLILDKDAQTTDEPPKPLPLAVKASAHIGARKLPQVIALSAGDSLGAVADLPATSDELISLLKSWGIEK